MRSFSLLLLALPATLAAQAPRAETPAALLDRGITRMGGEAQLRAVASVRLDLITQWLRTSFAEAPFTDMPSYEHNVELRDYRTPAWRNTRYFNPLSNVVGTVDVVRDTIAIRQVRRGAGADPTWGPLNRAYVQERRELFAFAPERLLLGLREAPDLAARPDTTIDGEPHARLAATLDGWPSETFIRRSDALPRLVRFRADATDDFGLAPWAVHEVEFWYSNWAPVAPGVLLPRQRDVRRVGKPYKRMTVLQATISAEAPADSFAVSDSLAAAYLATERRAMWDAPLDGLARVDRDAFAVMPPLTGSAGAVRIGGRWLVIEAAQATGAMQLLADWLGRHGGGAPIAGALATNVWTGNGGVPWFTGRDLPVHAAPGAAATLARINGGLKGITLVNSPRWIRVGNDSLWLEPVDVPDFRGSMIAYAPSLRWLWLPFAGIPAHAADQAAIIARLERRGLAVELIGGQRAIVSAR